MSAPSAASARAMARPMPIEAPDTRATCPSSFMAAPLCTAHAVAQWGKYIRGARKRRTEDLQGPFTPAPGLAALNRGFIAVALPGSGRPLRARPPAPLL